MKNDIEANEGRLFSPLFLRAAYPVRVFFLYKYLIGSITSITAPYITADFGLSPAQLGGFISVNLAAFGLAQFPLGVMLDRYGGRNTLVAMLLLACAGTLLFAAAESYAALLAARALIGAGFAGALLSSFKSFTHWLPKRRLPLAFSIQSFVGGVGFMAATHPVTLALEYFTWRQIMFASGGAVALSIAMLLFCAPREDCGTEGRVETLLSSACGMLRFAWDKRLWYVAPVVTATEAVLYSFAYLWIGPWMRDAAALGERSAGLMMLLSSAGIAAGYLLNGVTADFCSRWKWMTWERLYACTGVLFSALMGGLALFGGRAAPLWCPVMFLSTMR
ncbi:MFS transporter [uncultured Cloacibacillus sp.]|uniref:MFS transporter n=1 Tax=uncultured Cloacibacillus sp. TaxID=889794 RepID=UPI00320AFEC7